MIPALKSVAFADMERSIGIVALLETALEALDEDKEHLVAASVSLALDRYRVRLEQNRIAAISELTEVSNV